MDTTKVLTVAFTALLGRGYIVVIWDKIKRFLKPRIKGQLTAKLTVDIG